MKRTIKIALLACLILLASVLTLTACDISTIISSLTEITSGNGGEQTTPVAEEETTPSNNEQTTSDKISFKTLQVSGTSVYGTVSNDTAVFSFIDEVAVSEKATYVVSLDIYGMHTVITKTVSLESGNNTFYIFEQIGDEITLYTVTIRRKPIYTVTFNTLGGTCVSTQYVEEGYFATEPTTSRAGYTFDSWSYDFANPIMQDVAIYAKWNAHTNTPYQVEYYLQNVDYSYPLTPNYVDNLAGTTDTEVTAQQKTFEHFTFYAAYSVTSGKINGDGSLVLKVYYIRNMYVLSNENYEHGTITSFGAHKYGASVTSTATVNLGYEFVGWYSGDKLLSTDTTYTFTIDKDVEARFAPKSEMANFHFTATTTTCLITGIKDATIIEIIVPDYVTHISHGAFSGCNNLECITLPFVGRSLTAESDTDQYPFGYIFGTLSYEGGVATNQEGSTFYIPASLKSVTITGGNILSGAFYNCSGLTSITIPDSATSIDFYAFWGCSSLASVTIPNNVTSIGIAAFRDCSSLASVTFGENSQLTSIGHTAFFKCSSLTSITIPDSVTSIDKGAFAGCSSLTSITISDSVMNICGSTFQDCSSLVSVTFGENSQLTSIDNNAFIRCTGLTSITIPDSVINIGDFAFSGCSSLTSITIPNSVTSIGEKAFYNCRDLREITFDGTIEQWKAIGKGSSWNYNTGKYTIYCTDGTIPK